MNDKRDDKRISQVAKILLSFEVGKIIRRKKHFLLFRTVTQ